MKVSVHAAKTQLSRLLDLVEDGEEIVIQRHGRAVARLTRVRKRRKPTLGSMKGRISFVEGWDRAMTDDEADAFFDGRW